MASSGKDLPYGAEYAKSNRAACKGCRGLISQDSLRMSLRKPSHFFDGLQDNWFHFTCFWKKIKQNDVNEASIRGIELLKWNDQERIRKKINESQAEVSCTEEPSVELISEYAPSGRSKCVNCKENIKKNTLRLGMKSAWYHVNCFQKMQDVSCAENMVGFQDLSESDQDLLKAKFNKQAERIVKRKPTRSDDMTKKEKANQFNTREKMERLKAQANEMWSMREKLSKCLGKTDIQILLQANNQAFPQHGGESKLLDRLVDCVVFGCPLPCQQCKEGSIVYSSSERSYVCTGYISEYTRCMYTCLNPPRKSFIIPDEVKKRISEFKNFKVKNPKDREYGILEQQNLNRPEPSRVMGRNVDQTSNKRIKLESDDSKDAHLRMQRKIMKNGTVVDAECPFQEMVHVWKDENGKPWETTLGKADFQTGANSFYKLQLLKHDIKENYYLFRSWGRVGTDIGGTKTDKYRGDLAEAKMTFKKLFNEKTANSWEDVENFKKVPGKMSLIETHYKNSKELQTFLVEPGSLSKLPESIQQIIKMIFDVDAMNNVLESLEIDTRKMPLGILSIRHIKNAYKILTELQKLMEVGNAKYEDYLDATNRFFTLIPHNFGMNKPPLLNSQELLIDKTKLLDDLLDLEVTYNILKTDDKVDRMQDPVDVQYEKLHAQLEVLDKQSDEYNRILQYAANTHAPTHDQYKLEIVDIIRVKREGESERFKKNIPNHYLLWHGSRITNYAGILSQGLRIAPPEAPMTGYMFGKGIYFADLVSKSANYCYAVNTEGFILLCEVALGEIQEEINAKSIEKPSKGKHSVKGLGQTIPDPNEYFLTEDGVTIPMGKLVDTKRQDLTLLYNEFVVYDVAQVQIKYLVRANGVFVFCSFSWLLIISALVPAILFWNFELIKFRLNLFLKLQCYNQWTTIQCGPAECITDFHLLLAMAKWGEGDPRWIVEERPDAVNVNNWHWTEKNATPWSKQRLKELLEGQKYENGSTVVIFKELKKLDGEATANNRKAKLIFLFEWIIELTFEVKIAGSDIDYEGHIEIPNLSDENEASEVDITPSISTTGPHEDRIRHLLNNEVAAFLRKQLAVYIRELKEEFSKGLILPTDRAKPQVVSKGKTTVGQQHVDKKAFQDHVVTSAGNDPTGSTPVNVDVKSLSFSESFKVQPDQLWEVLTAIELVKKWSNNDAKLDLKPQGAFTLFGGMVAGEFVKIEPCKELAMKWRLKTYPPGCFASVIFRLKDERDSTTLEVVATGIPSTEYDTTESGLHRFYIQNIMRTFGFGMHIF
ncbi:unnamed protein product [Litomosoides sigmodontis]|uniref:Poly [ADP-ribose] polymerase n=1 Tax=Litomosoides sigmodontis TaxID=42156 RepID=A0A3P6SR10_LITSI|nr:unnamed protein product [Litomosoides sigmodontis]